MDRISRTLKTEAARTLLLVTALVAASDGYHIALTMYLVQLDRPLLMEFAFFGSAIIACFYEFDGKGWKVSLTGCLVTLVLFVVGVVLAGLLRMRYVELLAAITAEPEFAEFVGQDFYHAMTARVVGYGGCFAFGMLVVRAALATRIRGLAMSYFAFGTQDVCPTCGRRGHFGL